MLRRLMAVLMIMLIASPALAVSAPSFKDHTVGEIESYFANKSYMIYDRKVGTIVIYLRSKGAMYSYGTLAPVVHKAKWKVLVDSKRTQICWGEGPVRLPRGARVEVGFCVEAKEFLKDVHDVQPGDPVGLSKRSKPRFVLDGKKTSFQKLLSKGK